MVSTFAANMLIEDRACDMLLFGEDILEEMLFFGEDNREEERFRANASVVFLVCERALWGMIGASSLDALCLEGTPK
jgi:hypothetical protein